MCIRDRHYSDLGEFYKTDFINIKKSKIQFKYFTYKTTNMFCLNITKTYPKQKNFI